MSADPKSDIAVAGDSIAAELTVTLVRKGVIDRDTGLEILNNARKRCVALGHDGAAGFIESARGKIVGGG